MEEKLKSAPYTLPFKHKNSDLWDQQNSTIKVDKYNQLLLDVIKIREKQDSILAKNREEMMKKQKERTDSYWKRWYESKSKPLYTHEELASDDRNVAYLRSIGHDA